MSVRPTILLITLAAIWGLSFVFVRITVPAFGPIRVAAARVLIAAIVLLVYAYTTSRAPNFDRLWRQYLWLGLFNAALQFGFMAYAATRLDAAFVAVLVATMPLWSAPIATLAFGDPLRPGEMFGLLLGITGVGILVGGGSVSYWGSSSWLPVTAGLLSAASGAVGANYARAQFAGENALAQTIGQQLAGSIWLLPFTLTGKLVATPTLLQISALLALAVLSTGLAFLLYFRLIADIGATRTLTVEFLVPVFAALWGWLLLGERPGARLLIGGTVILAGCTLANGWGMLPGKQRCRSRSA